MSSGDRARILSDATESEAIVSGALLHAGDILPVTGDWVMARMVEPDLAMIDSVEPRRTKIARRAAGKRSDEQVLAANVDLAFLVAGLDGDFNARRIERYLALCHAGGVEPVILLNKADLHDPAPALAQLQASVRAFAISALTGQGCEAIDALLQSGVTAVLLGSSGAGKSSLLNRLIGSERQATQSVREHDSRGRHTTTGRELFHLASGAAIIDTPGVREIQVLVSEESIDAVFDEIVTLARSCRFHDCSHISEPGCAVRGQVSENRLESYRKLAREAARLAGEASEKQRWRTIHKSMKRFYKQRDET
jgi:ribosome biogenesis GTPase